MSGAIVVKTVRSRLERRRFQRLAWAIYAPTGGPRDPCWVPPVLSQERELLGWPGLLGWKHPFFDNAECTTLIAERDGQTLGRVAVLVNRVHNAKYNERLGFFGFFECVNDLDVARAILQGGEAWLRERGMTAVRGPVAPSLNYSCGLLVGGFERPPCILMSYNPPYYAALLERCGYAKSQDMYAYEMDMTLLAALVARYKPAVMSALRAEELVVRPLDTARFRRDIETYLDIYNRSLDGTWGFTPLQPREAAHIGAELRRIIVPEFTLFAEVNGTPVGALLALLDYNEILRTLDGRLFPLGFVRLVTGRRRIAAARVMAMTMVPGYQSAGLAIVLLDRLVEAAKSNWNINRYEFSWVLESNARSRGSLERAGTKITSTYRMYDKAL
ncbi:MAG: GNAT family N-acetyltransferase [Planctomycetes bacterium]|nr:GNAT family N-acetyltransferase [Planctomycetota bacterium]